MDVNARTSLNLKRNIAERLITPILQEGTGQHREIDAGHYRTQTARREVFKGLHFPILRLPFSDIVFPLQVRSSGCSEIALTKALVGNKVEPSCWLLSKSRHYVIQVTDKMSPLYPLSDGSGGSMQGWQGWVDGMRTLRVAFLRFVRQGLSSSSLLEKDQRFDATC